MLNYANLNDTEFEFLCKDIMSKKLNTPLRSFAPGKDGGIDLCNEDKSIIVQVKHYVESSVDALVKSLKKEIEKVQKLQPKEYYICCSKSLSPKRVNELYQHFINYMPSSENIITLPEMEDFLTDENNIDVLEKHYKLWITSKSILDRIQNNNIFIDCEYLLATIDNDKTYFVQTTTYCKAKEYLLNEKVLMLLGQPGVGKTTISKMLILYFASIDYSVRFTTEVTNLESLKKAISQNREQKEIILLDDCFGQAYFEIKSSQGKELLALIRHVKQSKNKILLLNSRITIYQEAQFRTPELIKSIESNEIKIHILDMSEMQKIEKAKILYNHLYFNIQNRDFFNAIKEKKNYMKIIEHKNYNPRIIEYISNPVHYSNIKADEYYNFITKKLDNPKEIWEDEYTNKLEPVDRYVIITIFSLTNTVVNYELAKNCFNVRIKNLQNIDTSIDQFEKSILRLSKNFLNICEHYGVKSISIANPSVTDFLRKKLDDNLLEKENILHSACNVNQFKRLLSEEEFRQKEKDLFDTGEICKLLFANDIDKMDYIVSYIAKNQVENIIYQDYIYRYFNILENNCISRYLYFNVLGKILKRNVAEYYDLKNYLSDLISIEKIFIKSDYEELYLLILSAYDLLKDINGFKQLCIKYLNQKIVEYCEYVEAQYFEIDIEKYISRNKDYNPEKDFFSSKYISDSSAFALESEIAEKLNLRIIKDLQKIPYEECRLWYEETPPTINVQGGYSMIEDYLFERMYEEPFESDYDSVDEIDLMFER